MDSEPVVFVTNDYALLHQEESVLDPTDTQILEEANVDKCISMDEAIDEFMKEKKEKIEEAEKTKEPLPPGLLELTPDKLREMVDQAGVKNNEFDVLFADMDKETAEFIRVIRVEKHYSWRAVARACYEWENEGDWEPPSNQIAGMKLCEYAAKYYDEDYQKEPWN